jgi:iron complex outermembrane receptor protein
MLEAGARTDFINQDVFRRVRSEVVNEQQQFESITSSFGAIYTAAEKFTVRANIATAWRPPNISELYSDGVHHGSASYEIGDMSLGSEQSRHASLGLDFTGKRLSVNAEVYVNHIENFIFLAPQLPPTLTIRGAFPTFAYRQTDALLRGFDAELKYQLPLNLQYNLRGSVLRATDQLSNEHLVLMPPDRLQHELRLQLPESARFGSKYVAVQLEQVAEQTRVPNTDFAPPPPAYQLLHFELGSKILIGSRTVSGKLQFNNLLNTRYRQYLNRFRYFTDELGRDIQLAVQIPFS